MNYGQLNLTKPSSPLFFNTVSWATGRASLACKKIPKRFSWSIYRKHGPIWKIIWNLWKTGRLNETESIYRSSRLGTELPNYPRVFLTACGMQHSTNEKSAHKRRKHCTLAVVSKKFSPRRRPLPGGAGRPKFNQLEMVASFTYKPSLVRIDARNFELSW